MLNVAVPVDVAVAEGTARKALVSAPRQYRLGGVPTRVSTPLRQRLAESRHTADLPDGVIYVPCGDRRLGLPALRRDPTGPTLTN